MLLISIIRNKYFYKSGYEVFYHLLLTLNRLKSDVQYEKCCCGGGGCRLYSDMKISESHHS